MPLSAVSIKNYRSVRNLWLPVEQLSIFAGANGVGKTNLYKALALLRGAADGGITRAIAEEGGLNSVLWAGRAPVANQYGWC
jgi:predicted ATPase